MKFVVATYGTEGDTRPFAALCRGLMDAGHEARLLADATTLSSANALGVPSTALDGNVREAVASAQAGLIETGGGVRATARALATIANANAGSWMRSIVQAGEGADAILASGLAAFAAFSAAERLGTVGIGAGTIPITPTSAFPSPFVTTTSIPRVLNRVSHRLVNAALWRAFRQRINAARAQFGLSPRTTVWTDVAMLYGISPHLLPRPPDWRADVRLCGQWLVPAPDWKAPPGLAHFLAEGEAPVYIGFGSMAGFDRSRMFGALAEALAGRRALISPGWSGLDGVAVPADWFVIGDTPHDWLFVRVAAVIHHGGAGTSHSAARAGVPSIVVPFAGDQFFWAERLRLAGVAPTAVDGRRPHSAAFARALDLIGSSSVRARAQELGAVMRTERGVANAVKYLERCVVRQHRSAASLRCSPSRRELT